MLESEELEGNKSKKEMKPKELVKEHERLVKILQEGNRKEMLKEASKQVKELKELKEAMKKNESRK